MAEDDGEKPADSPTAAATAPALAMAIPGLPAQTAVAQVPGATGAVQMDPAAYAQWLQAVQAQQALSQALYLQQIAAAAGGGAGGGVIALPAGLPTLPGLPAGLPAGLPGVALPAVASTAPAPAPRPAPVIEGPTYTGQIVDYNEEKGFGFIECKETQEIYGKDIFLLRSSLNGLIVSTGDRVNFRIQTGFKGPKAVEIEVVERIQEMADRLPTYYGIIKNFHHDRGLGFIECDETKDVYEKDILVLRSQLGEQVEGAVVSFNIVEDARGVKAANVKICPEGFPPGKEPKPRPPKGKGKGKGKEFGKDGKGFGKDAKGFGKGKGKFEQLWNVATNMLNEWGWWGNDSWDGGWEDPWWPGGNGDWQGQEGKGPGVAPTPTVLDAVRLMKASNLNVIVFKLQAACNVLSIAYGLQIANAAVLMTNMFGLACQVLFLAGERYASLESEWLSFALYLSVVLNSGIFVSSRCVPINLLGQSITVFNVFLYSSPLMNLGIALRTRNSSQFPTFLVVVNVFNNALWSIYALLIEDMVVLIPSLMGYACSFFQVLLILWCRNCLPFDLSFLVTFAQRKKPDDFSLDMPETSPEEVTDGDGAWL
ncbi:unnamed protein product [Durusdinium trenchii]|uniref:CSD domain-containing protein n=2 Tax=Durusdinium trenchii TaxID=1381693 RepID=A0ABP0REY0_9DINO